VFVSHHLDEVLDISDRITILRNGRKVAVVESDTADKDGLISMIVGRALDAMEVHRADVNAGDDFLLLDNVSREGRLSNVSLTVRVGEIVGLTGLMGGGANALAAVIGGLDRHDVDGRMRLGGEVYAPGAVREAGSNP
jgi:ribose transport system ATP-binding protein